MKKSFLLPLLFLMSFMVTGQTRIVSIVSGNWNTASSWSPAVVPGATDTAVINNTITIPITSNVSKLVITKTGTLINQSNLTVNNSFIDSGAYTDVSGTVKLAGAAGIKLGGTQTLSFFNLIVNNATGVTVTDTIKVKGGLRLKNGILNVSSGYLVLQGDATYNGRVVSCSSGDISGQFTAQIWDSRCATYPISTDYSTYG